MQITPDLLLRRHLVGLLDSLMNLMDIFGKAQEELEACTDEKRKEILTLTLFQIMTFSKVLWVLLDDDSIHYIKKELKIPDEKVKELLDLKKKCLEDSL